MLPFHMRILIMVSLLFSAAMFGFFYAWVCSTMWGLDAGDPRVAITAMQAMNASVRNFAFAPVFFGTQFVIGITAVLLWHQNQTRAAGFFAASAIICFAGAFLLTLMINVPMNEDLAGQTVPNDLDAAREIWLAYSPDWQKWNLIRTVMSGLSFLLAVAGILSLVNKG